MGKLAQRLADYRRSGTYRIEATDAIEEAAALNGFALERVALGDAAAVARAVAEPRDGRVLLFSGCEAHRELDSLLARLDAAGERSRERRLRFFAAFLDPSGLLPLAPLYRAKRR